MQQRQAVVAKAASRYQRSSKKEKGLILSELVELTEYSRVYARRGTDAVSAGLAVAIISGSCSRHWLAKQQRIAYGPSMSRLIRLL